jgi:cytoskeletal protein CcmA (bactofilin family)
MPSVILRDTKLQGNLTQKDSITVDGLVIGDIKSQEIIVSENGNITGNLTAELNIEVGGLVNGDISSDRIHLNKTARIKGKLFHRSLVVDEGAQLEIASTTKKKLNNKNNNVL